MMVFYETVSEIFSHTAHDMRGCVHSSASPNAQHKDIAIGIGLDMILEEAELNHKELAVRSNLGKSGHSQHAIVVHREFRNSGNINIVMPATALGMISTNALRRKAFSLCSAGRNMFCHCCALQTCFSLPAASSCEGTKTLMSDRAHQFLSSLPSVAHLRNRWEWDFLRLLFYSFVFVLGHDTQKVRVKTP